MSNILNELGIQDYEQNEKTALTTVDEDDELLKMLQEATEYKDERAEVKPRYEYADFEPLDINAPTDSKEDPNPLSLFTALPVETIVETVDITITSTLISVLKIDPNSERCENLETDPKDLKVLTKATTEYLDSKDIKISPLTALLITAAMIYGKKFMLAKQLQKVERKAKLLEQVNLQQREEIAGLKRELEEKEKTKPAYIPSVQNKHPNKRKKHARK